MERGDQQTLSQMEQRIKELEEEFRMRAFENQMFKKALHDIQEQFEFVHQIFQHSEGNMHDFMKEAEQRQMPSHKNDNTSNQKQQATLDPFSFRDGTTFGKLK